METKRAINDAANPIKRAITSTVYCNDENMDISINAKCL
jgi:hypothetical protein